MLVRVAHDNRLAARQGPGGDPVGTGGVTYVIGAGVGDDVAVDRAQRRVERRQIRTEVDKELIGEDDRRGLEPVRRLKRSPGDIVGLLRRARCEDGPRELAVPGVQRMLQVLLGGPGRLARGRPRALGQQDHNGQLHHARQRDALRHQGETSTARGSHGRHAGIGRAADHVDGGDFVLCLLDDDAVLIGHAGEIGEHRSRGAHGIGADELDSRRSGRQADGLCPAVDLGRRSGATRRPERAGLLADQLGPVAGAANIGIRRGLVPTAELPVEVCAQLVEIEPEQGDHGAGSNDVAHNCLSPGLFRRFAEVDRNGAVGLDAVVDNVAAIGETRPQRRKGRIRKGHKQIRLFTPGEHLGAADADVEPVEPAADPRHVALCGKDMHPEPGQGPGKDAAGRLHPLAGLAGNPDVDVPGVHFFALPILWRLCPCLGRYSNVEPPP